MNPHDSVHQLHAVVLAGGRHLAGFGGVQGQGLFAQDMLGFFGSFDGPFPVQGRGQGMPFSKYGMIALWLYGRPYWPFILVDASSRRSNETP